jgi:soluble lytic murein transglycosylase-like protein
VTAVRALLGGCLRVMVAAAPLQAHAAWRCVDPWGHVYLAGQDLGQAGMTCDPGEPEAEAADAAVAPEAAAPPLPAQRGMLVLAPPARVPAWLLPGSAGTASRTAYDALIDSVAQAYGQDAALMRAIVQVESGFDPNAVSPKGAIGLMQVMPSTAALFGLARPQQALFEPESNLRTGAQFLRSLLLRFAGDAELAVAAYNAGPGAVMRSGYAVPAFPETRDYVRNVMALYRARR